MTGCTEAPKEKITIAINPWPGYEFLYLAEQKGFFQQQGLNIQLMQLSSLSDTQRSYINGHADGLASTMIEAVQAQVMGRKPLKIVLIPDYSNGGDVIVARTGITSVADLKGLTVGCEVSSLGIYLLQRALTIHGLQLSDVNIINIEQSAGERALQEKRIDAFVSYPPVSLHILQDQQFHQIFSSAAIPNEILDTVAISTEILSKYPDFVPKIHNAWQMALDYTQQHPEDAYQIMAQRENISSTAFQTALQDLKILNRQAQNSLFQQPDKLQTIALNVCETLVAIESLQTNCQTLPDIIYRGVPSGESN